MNSNAIPIPIRHAPITAATTLKLPGRYPLFPEATPCPVPPVINDILDVINEIYHVSTSQILARIRTGRVAWPRQVAMSLAYEMTGGTEQEIGRIFHRHRSSVCYAKQAVEGRTSTEKHAADVVSAVRKLVKARMSQQP